MDVPCRFPGLTGSGKSPVVLRVHVQPGEKAWIDRPVLDVEAEGATFTVLSNVEGLIKEVRLRPGDALQPGRVIMWVEADRDALTGSSLASARLVPAGVAAPSADVQPDVAHAVPSGPVRAASTLVSTHGAPTDLPAFHARIAKLTELLTQIRHMQEQLHLQAGCEVIDQELERLRTDRFAVAIVGEFKRGKSTLINALLGEELLPADPLPCSAALIRLTYGEQRQVRIRYRSGADEEIAVERLRDFGTKLTPEAEAKAAEITQITVACPLDLCRARVDVFDTPGLNDEANMTEVTLSILPQVDAALLVMMPESPFSMTERRFVTERLLQADVGRVMFVVNAIDRIAGERDRDRLLQNIQARVSKDLASRSEEPVQVLGVSARMELRRQPGSGFAGLRQALEELLARHRGAIVARRAAQRILHGVQDALAAIDVRLAANAMTRHQREATVRSLELVLSEIRARSHEIRRSSDQTQNGLEQYVSELARDLHARLLEASRQAIDQFAVDSDDDLNAALEACISSVAMQHLEKLAGHIRVIYDELVYRLNAFLKQCAAAARETDRIARFSADTWKQAFAREDRGGFAGVFVPLHDCVVSSTWSIALGALPRVPANAFLRSVRARVIAEFKRSAKARFEQSVKENDAVPVLAAAIRRVARLPFLELSDTFNKEFEAAVKDFEQTLQTLRGEHATQEAELRKDTGQLTASRERVTQVLARLHEP